MISNKGHIHMIAIGGSAMHNLAIALKSSGYHVTGSDDEIFEPSRSRLASRELLPPAIGWHPDKINKDTQAVILGMHARKDNSELEKSRALDIPIYSFPEFIYQSSKNARRVVIAGSHGKTTITSMILHVLKQTELHFDYLAGASIPGFDNMVKLSEAPLIILEGDEYLSSSLDRTPKFIRYNHHTALISGIAWDHINAFPTRENYIDQFRKFIRNTPDKGILIYFEEDPLLKELVNEHDHKFAALPYTTPAYSIQGGNCRLLYNSSKIPMNVFGRHNMQNIAGAIEVLKTLDLGEKEILDKIATFKGASNRLEKISDNQYFKVYRDFAHSPSKVRSTTLAVKEMYPDRKIINCFELHTFSSLNKDFLSEYKHSLVKDGLNIVFLNDHTLKLKRMEYLYDDIIRKGFSNRDLKIIRNTEELENILVKQVKNNTVLLMMSSGNFGGMDIQGLIKRINKKF